MTAGTRTISEIGEFRLIERIRRICETTPSGGTILGIGDDAAVLRLDDARVLLATCDIQVEGVHFRREAIPPRQLGRRAMAINLSDIAAMGGSPEHALVSLALPGDFPAGDFDELFEGLAAQARAFGTAIIGGNLSSTGDRLVIDVTLLGYADAKGVLTRAGAQIGDGIWITGRLGWSAAGRDVLSTATKTPAPVADRDRSGSRAHDARDAGVETERELTLSGLSAAARRAVLCAHLEPEPRIREGQGLARSGVVTAMIDVSDGLTADLAHVCRMSAVGAEIEQAKIPVDHILSSVAAACGRDLWEYVLHGGEDYELLFTARPDAVAEIQRVGASLPTPFTRIGTVIPAADGIVFITTGGERRPLAPRGWDHFPPAGDH